MNKLFVLILALFSSAAQSVPLDTIGTFCGTFPDQCRKGTESLLAARGTGTNAYYVLEVDPTTGAFPVNVTGGSISVTIPANGPTGSAVPAQADYQGLNNGGTLIGAVGDSSGRTVVVGPGTAGTPAGGVLSVQGVGGGTPLPISGTVTADAGTGTFAVSAATLPLPTGAATETTLAKLTISPNTVTGANVGPLMMGNTTNSAPAYASSTINPLSLTANGALRVDGSSGLVSTTTNVTQFGTNNISTGTGASGLGIPRMTVSNDSTIGLVAGTAIVGKVGIDQTTPGTTNAVAATNFPTTVDTNSGAAGASTLRVVQSTRSEAAATPLSVRQSNGTSFADYGTGAAASTTLRVVNASDSPSSGGRTYADSVRKDYTGGSVTTGAWVQLIASTAATGNCMQLFDSSGVTLELGVGAAASETRVLIIPPGGLDACVPLKIPASSRLSVRAVSATASTGELDITLLN